MSDAGGVAPYLRGRTGADASYLARARQLCDEHGALLIFDEVQTGMGRLGIDAEEIDEGVRRLAAAAKELLEEALEVRQDA
jgi:acetylornithine/succinyldiaminopimelate/putrescine aminotransferase